MSNFMNMKHKWPMQSVLYIFDLMNFNREKVHVKYQRGEAT